ncbi:MAG TPA: diguanylate cyclase [Bacillota bacterium]|nr:diguanylate cyclase [Bacillota bacterium]
MFSALWIFFSDRVLLLLVGNIDAYQYISTLKGMFFILLSSFVIYFLVRHEVRIVQVAQENILHVTNHDMLTGIPNRNEFNATMAIINEENRTVTLVVTDINGLRTINELYGSQTGDQVLKFVASLLEKIPSASSSYRTGGDEFCTIFDGNDVSEIQKSMDSVMEEMGHQQAFDFSVSISIGLATKDEYQSIYETLSSAEAVVLKGKLLQEQSASNALILTLKNTLFEHSDETEQHAQRMVEICEAIGQKIDMSPYSISELKLFATLHDIGKVGSDDRILKKPGRLTDDEYTIIKRHSSIGYRIAKSVSLLESIADYILAHHERRDGQGYPQGLKETDIPLPSRILAIADTYMRSPMTESIGKLEARRKPLKRSNLKRDVNSTLTWLMNFLKSWNNQVSTQIINIIKPYSVLSTHKS